MAITNVENPTTWVTLTVKVPYEVHEIISERRLEEGHESLSETLRELIRIGLQNPEMSDRIIRANAEARALSKLSDALDDALIKFRESQAADWC